MTAWVQLPSGAPYYPLDPKRHIPSIDDIAHKGAQTNRYGGSCKFPYSINQHQVLGARAILKAGYGCDVAKAFMIHDMSEPLGFQDLPSPIKRYKPRYWYHSISLCYIAVKSFVFLHERLERRILDSLVDAYGVNKDPAIWNIVKSYDKRITVDEKEQVMKAPQKDWGISGINPIGVTIEEWTWQEAKEEWMELWHELDRGIRG